MSYGSINSNAINTTAINDVGFVSFGSAGPIVNFQQSVGVARDDGVFIIFDQNVLLRSVGVSGTFVEFHQDVQKTVDSQNIVVFNQKVIV